MELLVTRLAVRFGSRSALEDITVLLRGQGVVGLVGPNGSGKSTLLDVLSGFLTPTAGTIESSPGHRRLHKRQLRRLASRLHQALVVPPEPSVEQFLRVAATPSGLIVGRHHREAPNARRTDAVRSFLGLCGFGESLMHTPLMQLSWGQMRLAAIAAVVMTGRDLILLDEPFAGLSESAGLALADLLKIASQDRLVVLVEHDLDKVVEVADRVLVLVQGRLVEDWGSLEMSRANIIQYFGTD